MNHREAHEHITRKVCQGFYGLAVVLVSIIATAALGPWIGGAVFIVGAMMVIDAFLTMRPTE